LLDLLEKPAAKVIQRVVQAAAKQWPALIAQSALTEKQKTNLLANFEEHSLVVPVRKREARHAESAT
jgi:hypothetical protein